MILYKVNLPVCLIIVTCSLLLVEAMPDPRTAKHPDVLPNSTDPRADRFHMNDVAQSVDVKSADDVVDGGMDTELDVDGLYARYYRQQRHKHRQKRQDEDILSSVRRTMELSVVCTMSCVENMKTFEQTAERGISEAVREFDRKMQTRLSISVVLVYLEIWNEEDLLPETGDSNALRSRYATYREDVLLAKMWSDVTLFIIGNPLPSSTGDVSGVFVKGGQCTRAHGTGVIHYKVLPSLDTFVHWMLHEVGHSLSMSHDTSGCCPYGNGNCVMQASVNSYQLTNWRFSTCSYDELDVYLTSETSACLTTWSGEAFTPAGLDKCGNGAVDDGEECDCGSGCTWGCCDCCTENCQLKTGAQCYTGDCCDTGNGCTLRTTDYECRASLDAVCDQPEFCSGTSSQCPEDTSRNNDGTDCDDAGGTAGYCVSGRCWTYDAQCQNVFNSDYSNGDEECYERGITSPDDYSHCGEPQPDNFIECTRDLEDRYYRCAILQCTGPENIYETVSSIYRRPASDPGSTAVCLSVDAAHWEWWVTQGRLRVANGTKCGEDKACYLGECIDKSTAFTYMADQEISPSYPVSVCGNGVVEEGETCDCGPRQCGCCDSCQLYAENARCLYSECGICDGQGNQCSGPAPDYSFCDSDQGYCYGGVCGSLNRACQRYFGSSATAAWSAYDYENATKISEQNAGGYLLYNSDGWSQGPMIPANGDKKCGILVCHADGTAAVSIEGVTVDYILSAPSNLVEDAKVTYVYFEKTHDANGTSYNKYYPLLADAGTPCQVDGQDGYCSPLNLAMDDGDWNWYWYTECVPI